MLKSNRCRLRWLACILIGVAAVAAREPLNLSTAKAEALRYVDSGAYLRDLGTVAQQAGDWIAARAATRKPGEKLALVLDIDETALSNLAHMRAMDFGYIPRLWNEWVAEANAAPIKPIVEVFRAARAHGVAVFFITGRSDSDRPGTEHNLKRAGYDGYERLITEPDGSAQSTRDFKAESRRRLEADGWTIIANVGDQQSDLDGGAAEKTFKLPDPFYLIE